jgi:hypothetical protein
VHPWGHPGARHFVGAGAYPDAVPEDSPGRISPQERYEDLIDELLGLDGVTPPARGAGFGRSAVRFHGKIFVMFVRGSLVLKLPARRVEALVAAGEGVPFDANKGTPMKEWLSLDPDSGQAWLPLAHEALDFARAARSAR